MIEKVLAIETSCDDTSVAVVDRQGQVLGLLSASQDAAHEPYGGIVPEIASRNHTLALLPLIEQTMKQAQVSNVDGIAVTNRPGLMGALIVGVVTAKSLSQAWGIPFVGVNHLEGHLLAPFLRDSQYAPPENFRLPALALAISGGHTSLYIVHEIGKYEVIGQTKDDAAGEAFDKFAKMIGLGFPGGAKVDQLAKQGDTQKFEFPRAMLNEDHFDMSFSGLKSAAQRLVESLPKDKISHQWPDLCASYQEAIVDVLLAKLDKAAKKTKIKNILITGGVSANSRLRSRGLEWAKKSGCLLVIPPIRYCTDNAAMIGYAGILRLNKGLSSDVSLAPSPQALADDFLVRS